MAADMNYQLFETYFEKAAQAHDAGKIEEAKKLYMSAAESLYKSAKEVSGETKQRLMDRADKIVLLSQRLVVPKAQTVPPPMPAGRSEKTQNGKTVQEGEGTIWKSVGKPDVSFEDIAGLQAVKESIYNNVILPRRNPELRDIFQLEKTGGILLYGPPGTGKTMMAKAIAHEVDAEFYSIRCSDIVGKYFGEAEKNVKSLFETARSSESAVIFFDEFEALAAKRGGDSTVMNRLVPELLSQMDGFSEKNTGQLLFLAATNRPWDIDSAFLRPPRLTEKIFVGLPDKEARLYIIRKGLSGVPCDQDVDFGAIADRVDGYNGADIKALTSLIKLLAFRRSTDENRTSPVCREDVENALSKTHSSVQKEDVEATKAWEQKWKN